MEKNLGHATAYGYAKSKGYSGTEEEFAQLMADYASVGQSATQAAQTATSKASEAVTAAGTATTKASEASQSASTASTAAQTATDKASEATTAASTATAKASEAAVSANTATTAKTDAETARDAAAQSASEAAESARTLMIDTTLTKEGQAADAKAVGDKITDLKSALNSLADDGEIPVQGNVHNYYFGGGPNYATVTPSSSTRTMVFPIEDGANYHVKIVGNVFNVGYANEEYTSTGTLVNNTSGNPSEFDFTNTAGYGYLYVNYYNANLTPVENPHVDIFTDTELVTNERLNSALAPIEDWYTPAISYDGITDGKYITDTGYIGDSKLSCITDYVPIIAGRIYELDGVYLSSSRAVVYFDESKALIGASDKGSADTTIEITAPANAAYLRTNGAVGIAPVIKALNYPINADISALDDRVTDVEESIYVDNTIDIGTLTSGYVTSYNLNVFTSQTISHSDYIEVIGGARITVNNYCSVSAGGVAIIVFDKNHNGLEIISDGVGGGTVRSVTVDLRMSAKYIVINAKPATAIPSIVYVNKQYAWSTPINILNSLESVASKNFMQLFNNATQKPLCCIIDDDTMTVSDVEAFASLMETNGIRGTLATLTKKWETESGLEAKLHELETRGHQVVLHGYAQISAYKDAVAFDDANYKLAEADFAKGLSDMLSSGFCNPKYWVTPYGVSQNCMQRLAKKWGMKCLVTTAKKEYNGTDGKYTRWELQRSGLNPADTGALSYQGLLDLADSCAANNGWLIVNTHIYDWTNGYDRINDFITHCKNKGFEFLTLGEAMEIRWPVYNWYETF